ncbi:MAG: hypothetical protein HYS04_07105 [Acidobacteria bacterium]|nr:hypothetical protein [Acidobacteriota bacterium]
MSVEDAIAVVVPSCDRYRDLWGTFFNLFWRFWPDCPFRVYLVGNHAPFSHPRVTTILVGNDVSWSDNLRRALRQVSAEYIFLFIDDLLLVERVDTAAVMQVLKRFLGGGGNYLRLNPKPKPDRALDDLIGCASKGTIYRTATVCSVWKRETLLMLLGSGETAWDFEVEGSLRSDLYDGFYSTYKPYFAVVNGVIKGKWERGALSRLGSLNVNPDLSMRPEMSRLERLVFKCSLVRSRILYLVPARWRRRVKAIVSPGRPARAIGGAWARHG